jgi:hypothetical protein
LALWGKIFWSVRKWKGDNGRKKEKKKNSKKAKD